MCSARDVKSIIRCAFPPYFFCAVSWFSLSSVSDNYSPLYKTEQFYFFFIKYFFLPQKFLLEAPFLQSSDFYCIFHYSNHFNTCMVTHPSTNHGPSCLTSVILRELVFPTWYLFHIFFFCSVQVAYTVHCKVCTVV